MEILSFRNGQSDRQELRRTVFSVTLDDVVTNCIGRHIGCTLVFVGCFILLKSVEVCFWLSGIMLSKILTIDEVAEYLKIPKKTVYQMTRSGELPAFKAGKHWRVPQSELDAWITRQLPKSEVITN